MKRIWLRSGALALSAILLLALAGCGSAQRAAEKAGEKISEKAAEIVTEKAAEQVADEALESMGVSDIRVDGDQIKWTQDGEEVTLTQTEGEVPEGFPLPIYPGAEIGYGGKFEKDGGFQYMMDFTFTDDLKAVADFYEQVLADKGVEAMKIHDEEDDHIYYGFMGESDEMDVIISVEWYADPGENQCTLLITMK